MKRFLPFLILPLFIITSCGSSKKASRQKETRTVSVKPKPPIENNDRIEGSKEKLTTQTENIIKTALSYQGTRYRYGGMSKSGMDCSGLIYKSYTTHGVSVNRSSYEIAKQGVDINLKKVREGDLLFFATGKKSKRINHVGLVVDTKSEILFIHSTTSRGVLVSSLDEGYWKYAFIKAKRLL
ncbi:C40 family peptidase [Zhouia amylolytica]|uniref:Putative secreted peptidase-like protein n=1 Tax=Zhouia amylolytica AD3 TaxID=1286632 RepID=W2UIT1_9FLAO|nr:C40 family peptidase [Zhouia amylolytica]ETN93839.1 putative secreted peptidase-like protein [Zhouia amylolytica AD3]